MNLAVYSIVLERAYYQNMLIFEIVLIINDLRHVASKFFSATRSSFSALEKSRGIFLYQ